MDIWRKKLSTPIPHSEDVVHHLDQPLPEDAKIPILKTDFERFLTAPLEIQDLCTRKDVAMLFRVSSNETAHWLDIFLSAIIMRSPPRYDRTKNTFIHFWDDNIGELLKICLPDGEILRNSSSGTNAERLAPDFVFKLKSNCPLRGEENSQKDFENYPKVDLGENFEWTYDPAPYILGTPTLSWCSAAKEQWT